MKRSTNLLSAVMSAFIIAGMVWMLGCGGSDGGAKAGFVRAPESDFNVRPNDDRKSVEITKYTGPGGINIIIPATIQGLPVSRIGDKAFYESLITGAIIPEGVTEIGDEAFYGSVITNITIPNSVTSIGRMAFMNCKGLTSLTISNSLTTIRRQVFRGTGITSVTIPASVTKIEEDAFSDSPNLAFVISLNPTPPSTILSFDYNIQCLYVPANSIDAYSTATGWSLFDDCIRSLEAVPTFSSGGGKDGIDSRQLQKLGDIYVLATNQRPYSGKFINSNSDIVRDIMRDIAGDIDIINKSPNKIFTVHSLSGSMRDGRLHGEVLIVNLDGTKKVIPYRNGVIHGLVKRHHKNGQLESTQNFNDGKRNGKSESFHENGQLSSTGNFNDGKGEGKFEFFHENGQLFFATNFTNGKPDVVTTAYDETGQLLTNARKLQMINSMMQSLGEQK